MIRHVFAKLRRPARIALYAALSLIVVFPVAPSASAIERPFTVGDLESVFISEHWRDDGTIRLVSCVTGDFTDPASNAEAVWRFFSDKSILVDGEPRRIEGHHIAGIIGNMQEESGVLPMRLQNTGPEVVTPAESLSGVQLNDPQLGWGIVQWTPPGKFINTWDRKSDANILQNQLVFLLDQLNGRFPLPEGAAGEHLIRTTTIEAATLSFMNEYERPTEAAKALTRERRILAARAAYDRFNTLIGTVDSPPDILPGGIEGSASVGSFITTCDVDGSTSVVDIAVNQFNVGGADFKAELPDGQAAEFVSWVFRTAGVPFSGGSPESWLYTSVQALREFFANTAGYQFIPADEGQPVPGDVAFFIDPASGTNDAEIVVEVNGDRMITIGMNTNGVIARNDRSTQAGADGLVGYGRAPSIGGASDVTFGEITTGPGPVCTSPITINPPGNELAGQVAIQGPGRCFFLRNGTYNFSDIRLKDNTIIEGESTAGVIVDGRGKENAFYGNSTGVTIRNMQFRNFDNGGRGGRAEQYAPIRGKSALFAQGESTHAKSWLIEDIESYNNYSSGLHVGSGFIVRRSRFYNNGVTGISGDRMTRGGVIEANIVHDNGRFAASGQFVNGGGMKFTWVDDPSTSFVIRNNNVFDNQAIGIWCDLDCNNVIIEGNDIKNNYNDSKGHGERGIFYELSRNAIIRNNTITNSSHGNYPGGACITVASSQDVTVENNQIINCKESLAVKGEKRPYPGETYLENPANRSQVYVMNNGPFVSARIAFRNNTLIGSRGVGYWTTARGVGEADKASILFTNNDYSRSSPGSSAFKFWWERQTLTYSQWLNAGRQ